MFIFNIVCVFASELKKKKKSTKSSRILQLEIILKISFAIEISWYINSNCSSEYEYELKLKCCSLSFFFYSRFFRFFVIRICVLVIYSKTKNIELSNNSTITTQTIFILKRASNYNKNISCLAFCTNTRKKNKRIDQFDCNYFWFFFLL